MYDITYWQNGKPITYNHIFQSLWAATFKARAITESYGFPTRILNLTTGVIMIEFCPEKRKATYIDSDVPKNIELLALTPLE